MQATVRADPAARRRTGGALALVLVILGGALFGLRWPPGPPAGPALHSPARSTGMAPALPAGHGDTGPLPPTTEAPLIAEERRLLAAVTRHLQATADGGDPRQRLIALHTLLAGSPDAAAMQRAQQLAADLLAQSPDDEVLAMAQTWFCAPRVPCAPDAPEAWARAAPGNGAAVLPLLDQAETDPARTDALLARAAGAPAFDTRVQTLMLEAVAAFDGMPLPPPGRQEREALAQAGLGVSPDDRRHLLAAGHAMAMPWPPFNSAARHCRPPLAWNRAAMCHAVFLRLSRSTSLIETGLAVSMLEQLTRGTAEGRQWAQRMRDGQWRSRQAAGLRHDAQYWQDFQRHGEVVAIMRALQRAGIPTVAPPGWAPAHL